MAQRALAVFAAGAVIVTVALLHAGTSARGAEPYASWAFAIGNGALAGGAPQVAERLGGFDLVVVDGELARPAEVKALRAEGATVLAYLSVGTIERWRSWYPRLKRFRLAAWRDWEGEWFADVSKARLRNRLAGRIARRILRKGFDGLFLDNVDMIEQPRHRSQRAGMRKLVARLDRVVGEGLLFAQNGARAMHRFGIAPHLDGWNRENVTWGYDFDRRRYVRSRPRAIKAALRQLERMRDLGKVTLATDYTRRAGGPAEAEAIANACGAGALPYVSNIGLTAKRIPDPPLSC